MKTMEPKITATSYNDTIHSITAADLIDLFHRAVRDTGVKVVDSTGDAEITRPGKSQISFEVEGEENQVLQFVYQVLMGGCSQGLSSERDINTMIEEVVSDQLRKRLSELQAFGKTSILVYQRYSEYGLLKWVDACLAVASEAKYLAEHMPRQS